MSQFLPAARSKWRCSPIVILSHSKIKSNRLLRAHYFTHTGKLRTIGDPQGGLGVPKTVQNMPQIIRYSILHRSSQQQPNFPWWNHPIVKYFISTSYGTLGLPLETLRGPWGGPKSQKTTKTCLKSLDIPFSTFNETKTQFSHSEIIAE